MSSRERSRVRLLASLSALVTVLALMGGVGTAQGVSDAAGTGFQGEGLALQNDVDLRAGSVAPTGRQRQLVRAMGATAVWNDFGTPHSLTPGSGGFLATGLATDELAAARAWIVDNRSLFRLSAAGARSLEVIRNAQIGSGRSITLQQSFGALDAGLDGRITLGLVDGKLAYVSSSIAPHARISDRVAVSAQRAMQLAGARTGHGFSAAAISEIRGGAHAKAMEIRGFTGPQTASLVAVPTPRNGVRPAWLTQLIDVREPFAIATYVDALSGATLARESLVDYAADNPEWDVFPSSPPLDYTDPGTRETWCWDPGLSGCDRVIGNDSSPEPWDVLPPNKGITNTSIGNNAETYENWDTANPFKVGHDPSTASPTREYQYPWTNQWFESSCDPTVFESEARNDIDAAIANLFAMHNRMHDFAYSLGFTEETFNLQSFNFGLGGKDNDPEVGSAQAGGIAGGPPQFLARDNANQITPKDGLAPNTNMYLWQPIAGSFYSPCVDGDFDMSVIGHEYGHAISNRMVGGPNAGLSGFQAGAMGESWSDLMAMEYLNSNGFFAVGTVNPFAVGAYVTGDPLAGIRNYGMNESPLNYSDVGYDVTGPQVHADGEIWSATNFALRSHPDIGNEAWRQIMFDAFLLMPSTVSMVDARTAYIAADQMNGGTHVDDMWAVFASRGLGQGASSNTNNDTDPIPSFRTPNGPNTSLKFTPVDENGDPVVGAQLFVGRYQARASAVADTVGATNLGDSFEITPGTYDFLVRANGFGHTRVEGFDVTGATQTLPVVLKTNLASTTNGAVATGAGVRLTNLIDDTEATNWESAGSPVADKAVIVDLAGDVPHDIASVQVSALLFAGQNRFTALRQFAIETCTATAEVDCTVSSDFTTVFESDADAFPAVRPRPRAPNLIIDSFPVVGSATHVRFVVLTNQCTGAPDYTGEANPDNDDLNDPDCVTGSVQDLTVRAAELQVFGPGPE